MCSITVISREPYRAEKQDCGSCNCMDSRNANDHSYASLSDGSRYCTTCGHVP